MALRAVVAVVLGLLGVVCAMVGIFVLDGISIEFPGIIFGALGYYPASRAGTGEARSWASSRRRST